MNLLNIYYSREFIKSLFALWRSHEALRNRAGTGNRQLTHSVYCSKTSYISAELRIYCRRTSYILPQNFAYCRRTSYILPQNFVYCRGTLYCHCPYELWATVNRTVQGNQRKTCAKTQTIANSGFDRLHQSYPHLSHHFNLKVNT